MTIQYASCPPEFITRRDSLIATVQISSSCDSAAAQSRETTAVGRWLGQKNLRPAKPSPADPD